MMPGFPVIPVQPLRNGLVCPHCRFLLREARQTTEGDRVCRSCYEEIAYLNPSHRRCPHCRVLASRPVHTDRAVQREIDNIAVICPNEGCQWMGKFQDLREHHQHCQHQKVCLPCPNGCGSTLPLLLLPSHLDVCRQRMFGLPGFMLQSVYRPQRKPAQEMEQQKTVPSADLGRLGLVQANFTLEIRRRIAALHNTPQNIRGIQRPLQESTLQRQGPSQLVTGFFERPTQPLVYTIINIRGVLDLNLKRRIPEDVWRQFRNYLYHTLCYFTLHTQQLTQATLIFDHFGVRIRAYIFRGRAGCSAPISVFVTFHEELDDGILIKIM